MRPSSFPTTRALGIVLLMSTLANTAGAQRLAYSPAPADSSPSHAQLFTGRDLAVAAAFAGVTVAMFPLDKTIARRLEHDTTVKTIAERGATLFELISVPGAYVIGPGLYVVGRLGHYEGIQDLGLHGTEAVVLGTAITGALKGILGRSRPYVTADTNPRDFHFGKGFSGEDYSSFPSGHTTVAFAAASSVTSEMEHLWPGHTWVVAPVMYGGATLVGIARMYHDKHWASDIAMGAAVGTFTGLKVVKYNHDHPNNYIDRMLLHATIAPDGHGGMNVGVAVQ